MTPLSSPTPLSRPAAGIVFVLAGVAAISVNDMMIKQLSGGYPLHQMIFVRSLIGLIFMLFFVHFEGGWTILKTRRPVLHLVRCVMVLIANMSFFTALAVVPLADATALFFVAPLLITLLSIPILDEKVGPWRLGAVGIGFCGVVLMMQPWNTDLQIEGGRVVLILPVIGAAAYAMMHGTNSKTGCCQQGIGISCLSAVRVSDCFYWFLPDCRRRALRRQLRQCQPAIFAASLGLAAGNRPVLVPGAGALFCCGWLYHVASLQNRGCGNHRAI